MIYVRSLTLICSGYWLLLSAYVLVTAKGLLMGQRVIQLKWKLGRVRTQQGTPSHSLLLGRVSGVNQSF